MTLPIYHVVLLVAFIGIVFWIFARKRRKRFKKDAQIPFTRREG
jgi:cbb3-type cytochrome oxidase subunit 3